MRESARLLSFLTAALMLFILAGCGAPASATPMPTFLPARAETGGSQSPAVTPTAEPEIPYKDRDADGRIAEIQKAKEKIMAAPRPTNTGISGESVEPLLQYYALEKDARVKRTIEDCFGEAGFPQALLRAYALNPEAYRADVSDILCKTGWKGMTALLHYAFEEYPTDPWQNENKPLFEDLFTRLQDRYPLTKYIEEWNPEWGFSSDLTEYLRKHPDPAYVGSLLSFAAKCPVVESGGLESVCTALCYFPIDDRIVDFYVDLVTVKRAEPVIVRNTTWYSTLPAGAYSDAYLGKKPGGFNKDKIAVIEVWRESAKAAPAFSFSEYSFYNVSKEKRLSVQDLYCAKTAIYIDYICTTPTAYTSEIGPVTGYRRDCVITQRNLSTGKILSTKTIQGFDLAEKTVVSNTKAKELYGQPRSIEIREYVLSLLKELGQ